MIGEWDDENNYFIVLRPSEDEFTWEENQRKKEIIFAKPREIYNCDWNLFAKIDESQLIKKIDNQELSKDNWYIDVFKNSNDSTKHYFLKQTNIGDCFLVSSIISLMNMPGILYELFYFNNDKDKNYTDKDEEINLYCYYLSFIKTLVNIKNTYPTFKNQKDKEQYLQKYSKRFASNFISPIPFTTSRNGFLLGQALIKAFICFSNFEKFNRDYCDKCEYIPIESLKNPTLEMLEDTDKKIRLDYYEEYKMLNTYKLLNEGGNPENVMNIFLGCNTEIYFDSDKSKTFGFQVEIIKKIKKYIQLGGFIQVSHDKHSYSLLNYLEIKENGKTDTYFSILNPNRDHTDYIYEGIDSITENYMTHLPDFKENENIIKKSIIEDVNKHHTQTGHMILKDDFFLKWFLTLNFC